VYRRENSGQWQCSTYLDGRNHRVSTKTASLALAKAFARDWYLALQRKSRAGASKIEQPVRQAAAAYEREDEIVTEGQRHPAHGHGHEDRLALNHDPAPGPINGSETAPGVAPDYRAYRRQNPSTGGPGSVARAFSEKLNLALKALSMSRGGLALEMGVDKSNVGRWARGSVRPSSENLARLTCLVAHRIAGFTVLDWERDLAGLAEVLGLDPGVAGAGPSLGSVFHDKLLAEAAEATVSRGAAFEGFFRSTRPFGGAPGVFLHDHMMVRRGPNGLLRFDLRCDRVRVDGWILPQRNNLIVVGAEDSSGSPAFGIFNGPFGDRADIIDGLLLACALDSSRTPTACAVVFERVGELSGDAAADDARLDELGQSDPVATPDSASEALRAYLVRDVGPAQLALGGDWLLRMPLERSISRGAGIAQRLGGFARASSSPCNGS